MSKLRNTPYVYQPRRKRLRIQRWPGIAGGFHSPSAFIADKALARAVGRRVGHGA